MSLASIVDAGCDWITVTHPEKYALRDQASKYLQDVTSNDGEWYFYGYNGYKREGVKYGTGAQGDILILSGHTARDNWRSVAGLGQVTRCDWQCTYQLPQADLSMASRFASSADQHRARTGKGTRITFLDGWGAGDTLYLGARTSESFCRIYDKGAESHSDDTGRTWRVEVELKKVKARNSVKTAMLSGDNGARYAIGLCLAHTHSKGVVLPFSSTNDVELPHGKSISTDNATRLRWLQSSVLPALEKLRAAGLSDEIANILGISFDNHSDG